MTDLRSDRAPARWFRVPELAGARGRALGLIVLVLVALASGGDRVRNALRYEREGLAHHEYWRLVGAHVVHLGWRHLALNVLGLTLLWVLFAAQYCARRWVWIVVASMALIDAGLWWRYPGVEWYVGASGVLHGVMAAGALAYYRRGEWSGALVLLLMCAKLLYEQQSGHSAFDQDLPLVPAAHLLGALGGLVGAVLPPTGRIRL